MTTPNILHDQGSASEKTILDLLNLDCWRTILDYLDINEVVRSERVSRGWRQLVRDYLPGIHNFKIETDSEITKCVLLNKCGNFNGYRRLAVRSQRAKMFKRIGSFVESLICSNPDREDFTAMEQNCLDLEYLTYICTKDYLLPLEKMINCKQMKRVVFEGCEELHDAHLAQLIKNQALEELVINGSCILLTGLFLTNLRSTNLKSLILYHCSAFELACLFSAVDYLAELTRLDICHLSRCNRHFSEVCWLLERLPNLEHLALDGYTRSQLRDEFVEVVSRLSRLRHLSFVINENADDEWIEAVVRECKELRSLNLQFCQGVSGRGLVALCRARPTLSEMTVTFSEATDRELAACIKACPGLSLLDVSACQKVTPHFVRLASEAVRGRNHRLRLCVNHTGITKEQFGAGGTAYDKELLRGLSLDWRKN